MRLTEEMLDRFTISELCHKILHLNTTKALSAKQAKAMADHLVDMMAEYDKNYFRKLANHKLKSN